MKVGTKSVLFGAHCFFLHPIFVAVAWIRLYGFPFDPRIWLSFFVHDLGYFGKPNMDGIEGETHVELGAKIMHIFDGWEYKRIDYDWAWYRKYSKLVFDYQKSMGWQFSDILEFDNHVDILLRKRKTYWRDFSLYHSRYYAKKNNAIPSRLCYADKLAFAVTPKWLYLLMVNSTGEIFEYMKEGGFYANKHKNWNPNIIDKLIWHESLCSYMIKWIAVHKHGKEDTWTNSNRHER